MSTQPAAVSDPSVGALWICANLVDGHCLAHTDTLPSTIPSFYYSFRTHEVDRFTNAATLVAYTGETERREVLRTPFLTSSPGTPGVTTTWTVHQGLDAPAAGWPVATPVHLELIDATGVVVTTTQITFVGPRTPTRPVGVLAVCRADQLAGPATNQYCPTTSAVVIRDPAQDVWATYSSGDAALFARGFVTVLEHQRGQRWVELASDRVDPLALPADDIETLRFHFSMAQSVPVGAPLRVRVLSGDAEVGSATFTIQSP